MGQKTVISSDAVDPNDPEMGYLNIYSDDTSDTTYSQLSEGDVVGTSDSTSSTSTGSPIAQNGTTTEVYPDPGSVTGYSDKNGNIVTKDGQAVTFRPDPSGSGAGTWVTSSGTVIKETSAYTPGAADSTTTTDKNGNLVTTDATTGNITTTDAATGKVTVTDSSGKPITTAAPTTQDVLKAFTSGDPNAGKIFSAFLAGNAGSLTGLAALSALTGGNKVNNSLYSGSIPTLTAIRNQVANLTPGLGQQQFTDVQYVNPTDAAAMSAATDNAQKQATGIATDAVANTNAHNAANITSPPKFNMPWTNLVKPGITAIQPVLSAATPAVTNLFSNQYTAANPTGIAAIPTSTNTTGTTSPATSPAAVTSPATSPAAATAAASQAAADSAKAAAAKAAADAVAKAAAAKAAADAAAASANTFINNPGNAAAAVTANSQSTTSAQAQADAVAAAKAAADAKSAAYAAAVKAAADAAAAGATTITGSTTEGTSTGIGATGSTTGGTSTGIGAGGSTASTTGNPTGAAGLASGDSTASGKSPNSYTKYSSADIGNFINQYGINANDPISVAFYTQQANADPAVVNAYIASLPKFTPNTSSQPDALQQAIAGARAAQQAASAAYTKYTPSDIASYIATNGINPQDPAQVAAAEKATNADPSVVNSYISSLPAPPDALQQAIAGARAAQQAATPSADAVPASSAEITPAPAAPVASVAPTAPADPLAGAPAGSYIAGNGHLLVPDGGQDESGQATYNDMGVPQARAHGGLMDLHYAVGGQTMQPRYLQGQTDGMADKIPSSIDGIQPAKLSHGEFVVPADVVSHLGNGNSDAGAKKLYQMMDRIRLARTGNKKQGKEINPDKFMLGGSAYATGGAVAFKDGGVPGFAAGDVVSSTTAPAVTGLGYTAETGLSPYIGSYVDNMLAQAQADASAKMPVYKGELAAGPSKLQQQEYSGLSALANTGAPPIQFSDTFQAPAYSALQATSGFVAPTPYQYTNVTNQYQAPDAYTPSNITNTFQAPTAYNPTNVSTGSFDSSAAQQYMNPYVQASLDPQLQALQRQQAINTQGDLSKLTAQGAYGGSRQAVLEGANNYNLLANQSNLIGQGYNQAYTQAQNMFTSDQARQLQAQQANVQQAQFAATQGMTDAQMMAQYGMTAQQANEASKQFGATQAANAAQNNAQYGMAAQQANINQQQFGANLGMTAAEQAAQYSVQAQTANIAQQQFANQQAQAAAIQKAQFDAQAQAAQQAANMQSANFGLASLAALGTAGTQQQATQQAQDTASLNQFNQQAAYPEQQLTFQQSMLQNLPVSSTAYIPNSTSLGNTTNTIADLSSLYNTLSNSTGTTGGTTGSTSAGTTGSTSSGATQ